jgi:hypothetical protein
VATGLLGDKPERLFRQMRPHDDDSKRSRQRALVCLSVRPYPAEFVIFRIGQDRRPGNAMLEAMASLSQNQQLNFNYGSLRERPYVQFNFWSTSAPATRTGRKPVFKSAATSAWK